MDFHLSFPAGPVTLAHPTLVVRAGATTLLHGRVPPEFTPGRHRIEIPVEISNLHPRPGTGLASALTVEIETDR